MKEKTTEGQRSGDRTARNKKKVNNLQVEEEKGNGAH